MDRDFIRLLFFGCFIAPGCRTNGRGRPFRGGRGAKADDGQWLRGTWVFCRRHPGVRSFQDVLALSLLEKDGRRGGGGFRNKDII